MRCGGFYSTGSDDQRWLSCAFHWREGRLVSRRARIMRCEYRRGDKQREALGAFGAAALYAATAHQHRP